jgi:hypothetical protein
LEVASAAVVSKPLFVLRFRRTPKAVKEAAETAAQKVATSRKVRLNFKLNFKLNFNDFISDQPQFNLLLERTSRLPVEGRESRACVHRDSRTFPVNPPFFREF